jgi:hypothetical protein
MSMANGNNENNEIINGSNINNAANGNKSMSMARSNRK